MIRRIGFRTALNAVRHWEPCGAALSIPYSQKSIERAERRTATAKPPEALAVNPNGAIHRSQARTGQIFAENQAAGGSAVSLFPFRRTRRGGITH